MKMDVSERVIQIINRTKQLATDLKAMEVNVHDQEFAMIILCGLPSKFEHLIVAINAHADDKKLSLDFVKSRLLRKEQRMSDRGVATKYATKSVLLERSDNNRPGRVVPSCTHCK